MSTGRSKNQDGGLGAYSGDYTGDTGGDLNWMPNPDPRGKQVRDLQNRTPGKQRVIDDHGDRTDGGGFSGPVSRSSNHPKY
jgi:hypothetical protein